MRAFRLFALYAAAMLVLTIGASYAQDPAATAAPMSPAVITSIDGGASASVATSPTGDVTVNVAPATTADTAVHVPVGDWFASVLPVLVSPPHPSLPSS